MNQDNKDESASMEKKNVNDREYKIWKVDSFWQGVKNSNKRENEISDMSIKAQIQASAIFVAILGVLLRNQNESIIVKIGVVSAFILFGANICMGIFALYKKESFWQNMARKNHLCMKEWIACWKKEVDDVHADKACGLIIGGSPHLNTRRWPVNVQSIFFVLAVVVSLTSLALSIF